MAKDAKIRITAEDKTKKSISGIMGRFKALGKVAHGLRRGFSAVTGGLVRGFRNAAFAMTAAVAAGAGLVKTFMVQEDAESALAAALGHTGDKLKETIADFKAFASSIQDTTRFGDEAILAQIAYAKNLGVTEDKLKDTTTAAIGLAAKLGIDLKTSMMLMGRAALGQTQMLTRYGVILDETLTPAEKFNALLKIGAKAFILAEKAAQTTAGRFVQFKNKIGDVAEALGGGIVEALGLDKKLNKLTIGIDKMLKRWKDTGTIDTWAQNAKSKIDKTEKLIEDLFSGDEKKRSAAVSKIKDTGKSMGESIANTLLPIVGKVGKKVGQKIVDVLVASAPLIGKALANAFVDIAIPTAEAIAMKTSERINPLHNAATSFGSAVASAQGGNVGNIARVTTGIYTAGLSEVFLNVGDRIVKAVNEHKRATEGLTAPEGG